MKILTTPYERPHHQGEQQPLQQLHTGEEQTSVVVQENADTGAGRPTTLLIIDADICKNNTDRNSTYV